KRTGLCRGTTLRWLEAALLGRKHMFYKRINKILYEANTLDCLRRSLNQLNQKTIAKIPLTPAESELQALELPAFFESIVLYQNPSNFQAAFNAPVVQQNFETIAKLAGSDALQEVGGLVSIASESMIRTETEIIQYLAELRNLLENLVPS